MKLWIFLIIIPIIAGVFITFIILNNQDNKNVVGSVSVLKLSEASNGYPPNSFIFSDDIDSKRLAIMLDSKLVSGLVGR